MAVLAGALLLLASGCSGEPSDGAPTACPESSVCPAGTGSSLTVGERVGADVQAFSQGQKVQIVYGPQGGQHFFADLALATDEPGEWLATIELVDTSSGAQAGANTRRIRACACPTFADDVPVFLVTAQELTGTLKVSAESPSGQVITLPEVELAVRLFL